MKKVRKVITAILLVLAVHIVVSSIISSANHKEYYIATADLNVRTGAGTEYAVVFTLQKGHEVEVLSKNNNWYQVRYLEKKGYAYSKYLKHSRTVSDANSNSFQQTKSYIVTGVLGGLILIVGFLALRKARDIKWMISIWKTKRGTRSERNLVLKLLKSGIPEQMIFHDLYLKKNNGKFSQIDLVAVTEVGIIVFEVKDYSGWIFGNGNYSQWTQVLAYGKEKHQFYNPIMQNNAHIKDLKNQIRQFRHIPFFSVVVFYGDCKLKDISFVPDGTFIVKSNRIKEVMNIIMRKNETAQYSDKYEAVRVLKEAVQNGENTEIQTRHIQNIKDMLGKHRVFD